MFARVGHWARPPWTAELAAWDGIAGEAEVAVRAELLDNGTDGYRASFWRTLTSSLLLSLAVHLGLLIVVAQLHLPGTNRTVVQEVRAWMLREAFEETPLAPAPELSLATPSDDAAGPVLVTEAMSAAPTDVLPPSEPVVNAVAAESAPLQVSALAAAAPSAETLDDVLVRHGSTGEAVADAQGAVDRIAFEIITALEDRDVLVTWLMDASNSLREDRQAVAARLERIYQEIAEAEQITHGSLLASVCSFGQETRELVAPTAEGDSVVAGIRQVGQDESGIENVFTAVTHAVTRYKNHRQKDGRRMMIVVWTDESGDDENELEDTVELCRRTGVAVYVVGPSSMFGQRRGVQAYRHPDDGKTYLLPVDRGPDSPRPERLRLPYWFEGDQFDQLRGGVGPFALVRLAYASGGAYFINEKPSERSPFALAALRAYLPEYGSPAEYFRLAKRSSLRQAVLQAVDLTWERELKGTPRQEFAPTGDNFQQELGEAQQTAAYNLMTINQALAAFGGDNLEKQYEREPSARWRAWYDLTRGRLLAMWVRCTEYNWHCAVMKGKGAAFVNQQSNRWRFKPDEQLSFGNTSERNAAEAQRLLERCRRENPDTPWALLAERELRHPLGFHVDEAYVPPPPPPKRMPRTPENNPPPGRREERIRQLPREQPVELPKL